MKSLLIAALLAGVFASGASACETCSVFDFYDSMQAQDQLHSDLSAINRSIEQQNDTLMFNHLLESGHQQRQDYMDLRQKQLDYYQRSIDRINNSAD